LKRRNQVQRELIEMRHEVCRFWIGDVCEFSPTLVN